MKNKHIQKIFNMVILAISLVLIGISFCPCCHCDWENWKNIFLSLGTGFLSAIILSIGMSIIENVKNKRDFTNYAEDINTELTFLFQSSLHLIKETTTDIDKFNERTSNKTLVEILKYIKEMFIELNEKITPYSVSENGEASFGSLIKQDDGNKIQESIKASHYLNNCDCKFSILADNFKNNKMFLYKYVSPQDYANILALLQALSKSNTHTNLNLTIYNNINDITVLLEKIDLTLLNMNGKYYFYHELMLTSKQYNHITQQQKKNIN